MRIKTDTPSNVDQQSSVLGPAQLKATLHLGNTAFYDAIRGGRLPAPSFYLGAKSPRWFWGDVEAHLKAMRGRKNKQVAA